LRRKEEEGEKELLSNMFFNGLKLIIKKGGGA
jgi:hypothetical protein